MLAAGRTLSVTGLNGRLDAAADDSHDWSDPMTQGEMIGTLGPLTYLFISVVGVVTLAIAIMFAHDVAQSKDAIRRNFPVIGRFRGLFTRLGEFFRQYFFALDREEMPFNRAQRDWTYRAAIDGASTVPFGSTRSLNAAGTVIFINCPFPPLAEQFATTEPMTIGPHCRQPYSASSFFNISAMSFGALSVPAVQALSHGAKLAGCWLNTGEGGLSRFHLEGGCDLVFQIGTANYGVRRSDGRLDNAKLREVATYDQVKMFELKLAQGAKPGKGGILPGCKVTPLIAEVRGIPAGIDSISPNRHIDASDTGELLDLVDRIRDISGKPVGIKIVVSELGWPRELCESIRRRGIASAPDFITLDGGDGGTGAGPMALVDNVGLKLEESLPMLCDVLHQYGLRARIPIVASGKRINPTDVAWALCAGAAFVSTARGFMFSLGCIQAMRCNTNKCPTGVTTHNQRLQRGLDPMLKKARVANYSMNMIREVEMIAHSCGVTEPRQLRREHVRIVQPDGRSVPMDQLFPLPAVKDAYV